MKKVVFLGILVLFTSLFFSCDKDVAIHFDGNGGEGDMESLLGEVGESAVLSLNVFTRENAKFIGWSLDKEGIVPPEYGDGESIDLIFSLTLYALWSAPVVVVEGGTFSMGSIDEKSEADEKPVHSVTLDSFYMGTTEVTQRLWVRVMGEDKNYSKPKGEDLPVEFVSWYDAVEFCNALSIQEGFEPCYTIDRENKDSTNTNTNEADRFRWDVTCDFAQNGYRLPTESEWEYAARGGKEATEDFLYSGSDVLQDVAWYFANSAKRESPDFVGKKGVNDLGLYDMSGNVMEWCWDWHEPYSDVAQPNPTGAVFGKTRVVRGGGWRSADTFCRISSRGELYTPSFSEEDMGIRFVRAFKE